MLFKLILCDTLGLYVHFQDNLLIIKQGKGLLTLLPSVSKVRLHFSLWNQGNKEVTQKLKAVTFGVIKSTFASYYQVKLLCGMNLKQQSPIQHWLLNGCTFFKLLILRHRSTHFLYCNKMFPFSFTGFRFSGWKSGWRTWLPLPVLVCHFLF